MLAAMCWSDDIAPFDTDSGVKEQGTPWMTIPASRFLLGPWRNLKVTVPGVVGVHVKVVGLPAARENPWGTLKGLGFAAQATVANPPRTESSGRRIVIKRVLGGSIIFWFLGASRSR